MIIPHVDTGNRLSKERRNGYDIIAEILGIAKYGQKKTQIMYGANLSFRQLEEYLSLLLGASLLEKSNNPTKNMYKTTKKGMECLDSYHEMTGLLKKEADDNTS